MMVSNSLYKCVSMCLNENIMINNLNREIKKQMETLELKYERWHKKLGGFNSRADTVEENITELEGGVMETKKKKND